MPKANVGIIIASSSSIRQRIQTIGRVLRKNETNEISNIYVIYTKQTTDEENMAKVDWEKLFGGRMINNKFIVSRGYFERRGIDFSANLKKT